MTDETKPRASLGGTIGFSIAAGALGGALVGSGLEDLLSNFELHQLIAQSLEYFSYAGAALGSLTTCGFGISQYLNRDEREGMLVIHTSEAPTKTHPPLEPQMEFSGLARALENSSDGVTNKKAIEYAYLWIVDLLKTNPLDKARTKYKDFKGGLRDSLFDVLCPFKYQERTIDPTEAVDQFFATGDKLHGMLVERLDRESEVLTQARLAPFDNRNQHQQWYRGFRNILVQELDAARDIALFFTYLSKRGGPVGSGVRDKMRNYGISSPEHLAGDVDRLGKNILSLYDATEKKNLSRYPG